MAPRQRIAIILLSGLTAYLHNMVMGIAEFARTQAQWRIFGLFIRKTSFNGTVDADGAIVFRDDLGLLHSDVPRVYVGTRSGNYPAASVHSDNHRIGELAAEHLLERNLRTFSCVCDSQRSASALQRREGFRRRVESAGARYIEGPLVSAVRFDESRSIESLARWVSQLPDPIGVMGVNDVVARQVADACRLAQRHVPDQIAIVGVDNEELMCMLSDPPLSSVDPDAKAVGYHAAAMLARVMSGEVPPDAPLVVPPAGVMVRQSSDMLAINDSDVADAVRFIRDHCTEPISVGDVLKAVPAARRSLDRRFRQHVGRTVHSEIQHARIRRARELLTRSNLPIAQVAYKCGFGGREYFTTAFTRMTGCSPGAYRRQFQIKSDLV